MTRMHQFYYTNYGSGYRLEASSVPGLRESDELTMAIQAQAGIWEYDPVQMGAETVSWSQRAGSYMAAMTVPCIRPGDTRPGFWSHVILPDGEGDNAFMACLSWPLSEYETQIRQGARLEDVSVPGQAYNLRKICARYGLYGSRLAGLILACLRSAGGEQFPAVLVHSEESQADYNQSAREIMSVIYQILPQNMHHKAGYQALTDKASPALPFVFCGCSSGEDGFSLRPDGPCPEEKDGLAREMGMRLASLFESDPAEYKRVVDAICRDEKDRFETMLWSFFNHLDPKTELEGVPQDLRIRHARRLLGAAGEEPELCRLLDAWLASIRLQVSDARFTDLTDLSLQAAVLIRRHDKRTYRRTILRCRDLLKKLSNDDEEIYERNLETISVTYPEIAADISPAGQGREQDVREIDAQDETGDANTGIKEETEKKEAGSKSRVILYSMLFFGFYMGLIMSLCSLMTDLARQNEKPLIFVGGLAAVIVLQLLLQLAGGRIGILRRKLRIQTRKLFTAGIVLAVIAGISAVAGSPAAAAVSAVGTGVFWMLLSGRS